MDNASSVLLAQYRFHPSSLVRVSQEQMFNVPALFHDKSSRLFFLQHSMPLGTANVTSYVMIRAYLSSLIVQLHDFNDPNCSQALRHAFNPWVRTWCHGRPWVHFHLCDLVLWWHFLHHSTRHPSCARSFLCMASSQWSHIGHFIIR